MYYVLSYYYFTDIASPDEEVARHKHFFKARDVKARIYISSEGINGQLSAPVKDAQSYMEWMKGRKEFKDIVFKIHEYKEHALPRLTVKKRKQLVALDYPVDLKNGGEYLSPEQWKEMLENDDKHILIDVRNDYEYAVGKFEGCLTPPCKTFREFPKYADSLKESVDPETTPVMMYCTGGIRCELYSAVLKEKGFKKIYQLEGGVVNYGQKVGGKHWLGKLFVFDDRMTVPISDEETPVIGRCHHCNEPCESYYNCANMDCNQLMISCLSCLKKLKGCCSEECQKAPRVRSMEEQLQNKPFRRIKK